MFNSVLRVFVLVLVGVLGTGCSSPGDTPVPETTASSTDQSAEAVRNEDLAAKVTVEIGGERQIAWEGDTTIRITRAGNPDLSVNLLSVGMVLPEQLANPRESFRWAFDMVNEFRDEPGTYQLAPPQQDAQISSTAFVIYIRAKEGVPLPPASEEDTEAFLQYAEVRQPCTVVIEDDAGERGRIECADLGTPNGGSVSLRASWDATAAED